MYVLIIICTCTVCVQIYVYLSIYKRDTRCDQQVTGLRLVPKLKFEHIYLSSFSKMRVDLAAQVRKLLAHVQYLYWCIQELIMVCTHVCHTLYLYICT